MPNRFVIAASMSLPVPARTAGSQLALNQAFVHGYW